MPQENNINLSIVIPVYNEDQYLETLFDEILKFFNRENVELIFVDDGSTDNTKQLIHNLIEINQIHLNL